MTELAFAALGAGLVLVLGFVRRRWLSFAAQTPGDYRRSGGPGEVDFDIRTHLNGPITCDGVIYGPSGRVTSRFVADMEARWSGETGVMREHFRYDDGTSHDRLWHLLLHPDGRVEATADDVPGGAQGRQTGPAFQMRYRIRLPEASGGHVLHAIDWMYLTPDGTIVNRSQFRKFGIQVAELVATMRPAEVPARSESEAA
ncbi:MAG: DUF3833 domain-containing protein [Marinibacterium sp.]